MKKEKQVLGIVAGLIILLGLNIIFAVSVPKSISGDLAGQKLVEYLNQANESFTYNSFQDLGLLYGINLSYMNESGVVYMTKDGKYLIPVIDVVTNSTSGKLLPIKDAKVIMINYLNNKTGGGVKYLSYSDKGYFYQISVKYLGEKGSVYITKDGKYGFGEIYPIKKIRPNSVNTCRVDNDCIYGQTCKAGKCMNKPEINKNPNIPDVQVFVFSYCPYGLQFEKGLFPVYDLLKNKANISIVYIGAMHGEFEHVESLRQICIEKNYGKDKLFSYLKSFDTSTIVGDCSGNSSCLYPILNVIYDSLNIDKTKIDNCMTKDAEKIYQAEENSASTSGISGSPTLVINGVEVETNRDPASILKTICSKFKTQPSECSTVLSTQIPAAGFGPAYGGGIGGGSCGSP